MRKKISFSIIFNLFIVFSLNAQNLNKTVNINGFSSNSSININNISTIIYNDGYTDVYSFIFPKHSKNPLITAGGFLFGVKFKNEIYPRVGGSYYSTGLQPGIISSNGKASDPNSSKYRVYRVRPDIYVGGPFVDLSEEAKLNYEEIASLRSQYEKDWIEWPADLGAPFNDVNNNGIYEPSIDIPGVPGTAQTLWYVANDLDSTLTKQLYGADPIGIEIQSTIWAYNVNGPLGNTIFRKFKLINKSKSQNNLQGIVYDSMFVAMFSDADIGNYNNDVQGSDSSLSLSYMYNSSVPPVYDYSGFVESSLGLQILSGPTVDSPGDSAIVNGKKIVGKRNLKATSAFYTNRYENDKSDPRNRNILGSQQFYNLFNGKYSISGIPFYDPVNQRETKFSFDGDLISNTGWIERLNANDDKRFGLASGPFTIAPGDTQEVVFAEFGVLADDRISSVKAIRYTASVLLDFYKNKNLINNIPSSLVVQTSSDETGITLDWVLNQEIIDSIENYNSNGYQFQGYNIYQLQHPYYNIDGYKLKLTTFDKVDGIKNIIGLMMDTNTGYPTYGNVQFGNDTGLKRKLLIASDSLGQNHFIIGKTYYFGVSSYTYNSDPSVLNKTTESLIKIIPVIFRPDYDGKKYSDTLNVVHSAGSGNANNTVIPIVQDPQLMSGDTYKVTFNYADSGKLVWNLTDISNNNIILSNQELPSHTYGYSIVNILDGVHLLVRGSKDLPFGSYDSKMNVKINNKTPFMYAYAGGKRNNVDTLDLIQDLEFRFTGVPENGANDPNDTIIVSGGSFATMYNINITQNNKIRVPFEIWEVERNRQINAVILSREFFDRLPIWGKDGFPLWYNNYNGDFIVPVSTSYNPNFTLNEVNIDNSKTTWNVFILNQWYTGDVLTIFFDNPLTNKDIYTFSTNPLNQFKLSPQIPDNYILEQNYPNPFNPYTTIIYSIPESGFVSLEIFNILGQKVKTVVNKIESKGFHQIVLDLSNYSSGVYIYTLNINNNFKSVKKMVLLK